MGVFLDPLLGPYLPRVRRDLKVVPRGICRRALVLCAPVNQQSVDGGLGWG